MVETKDNSYDNNKHAQQGFHEQSNQEKGNHEQHEHYNHEVHNDWEKNIHDGQTHGIGQDGANEEQIHHAEHDKQKDHDPHGHTHHDHGEEGDHQDHDHHNHHGEGGHHHHHGNFKELFLKSLPLGIFILILSPMMGIRLPFQFTFPYSDLIVGVLSTALLIYGGKPFYQGAVDEFKQKSPGMMALVSLGISVSYLYSVYAVALRYLSGEQVMDFFFEFASLILIMLLGHWIEMKAVGDAGDAQKSLAGLLPKDAHVVLADDSIETRPVPELVVGDIVRVQAGENVPADGVVVRGESRVNEALLNTGW